MYEWAAKGRKVSLLCMTNRGENEGICIDVIEGSLGSN